MKFLKSVRFITLTGLVLALATGCAANNENWPTVSFGEDIAASEASRDLASPIDLAPLPALSREDRAGSENPTQFLQTLETDFAAQARRIFERKQDYISLRQGLEGVAVLHQVKESWLSANMELSNISQTTERLKTLRARIMLLGDPLSVGAEVLLKKVEALELENRLFIREERAFLALRNPDSE